MNRDEILAHLQRGVRVGREALLGEIQAWMEEKGIKFVRGSSLETLLKNIYEDGYCAGWDSEEPKVK